MTATALATQNFKSYPALMSTSCDRRHIRAVHLSQRFSPGQAHQTQVFPARHPPRYAPPRLQCQCHRHHRIIVRSCAGRRASVPVPYKRPALIQQQRSMKQRRLGHQHRRQVLAKVNAATLAAGDQVLFNRGDSWQESLVPPASGASGLRGHTPAPPPKSAVFACFPQLS